MKKLRRELDAVRMKSGFGFAVDASASAAEVKGVKVLAQRVDGVEKAQMRELVDRCGSSWGVAWWCWALLWMGRFR